MSRHPYWEPLIEENWACDVVLSFYWRKCVFLEHLLPAGAGCGWGWLGLGLAAAGAGWSRRWLPLFCLGSSVGGCVMSRHPYWEPLIEENWACDVALLFYRRKCVFLEHLLPAGAGWSRRWLPLVCLGSSVGGCSERCVVRRLE